MAIAEDIGYPDSDLKISRLRKAMEWSNKQLKPFRERRLERLQAYVGFNYTQNGSPRRMPINLMELAVGIYSRKLTPSEAKVLVTTFHLELKPAAAELEIAVNHLLQEIRFGETIGRVVMEALFGMGIVKVGLNIRQDLTNRWNNAGQPFADCVSMDDWIQDMQARRYDECAYAGNRYRLPLEYVQTSGEFQNVEDLTPTKKNINTADTESRADRMSKEATFDDEYEDQVELWDIWLPRERVVLTVPLEGDGKILKTVEWEGPEGGPFDQLILQEVPANALPLPPSALWQDLNELENRLFRKLSNQADRQKNLMAVQSSAVDDAKRITEASDGEAIRVDSLDGINQFSTGGIDQSNFAFAIQVKDLAMYLGGNLDALGGLGPQTDTFGQDQLLTDSANERLAQMRERTLDFTSRTAKALAHWLWYDPVIELPLVHRLPAAGIEIPFTWGPDNREGDFLAYNLSIDPYSSARQSPMQKLGTLRQLWQEILLPSAPLMAEQGIAFNYEAFLKTIAKYADLPELMDIIMFTEGELSQPRGPVNPQGSAKPASTTRNYVRTNRPGATRQGADQTLISKLMGGNPQESEAAAIGRPMR